MTMTDRDDVGIFLYTGTRAPSDVVNARIDRSIKLPSEPSVITWPLNLHLCFCQDSTVDSPQCLWVEKATPPCLPLAIFANWESNATSRTYILTKISGVINVGIQYLVFFYGVILTLFCAMCHNISRRSP